MIIDMMTTTYVIGFFVIIFAVITYAIVKYLVTKIVTDLMFTILNKKFEASVIKNIFVTEHQEMINNAREFNEYIKSEQCLTDIMKRIKDKQL